MSFNATSELRSKALRAVLLLLPLWSACTTTSARRFVERSYVPEQELTAKLGEDVFSVRHGQHLEAKVFVGLIFGGYAKDTWEEEVEEYQLIFEGVDQGDIKCSYRFSELPAKVIELESRRNPVARSPAHRLYGNTGTNTIRDVRLPLGGPIPCQITYAGVELEVLELTPQSLRFRVIADSFGESDPIPPVPESPQR